MLNVRVLVLMLVALAISIPAAAQSVVSTHSGVVYFFAGTVYVGDEKLEQKFGKFPDIGEGRELRTEQGRAEVLLTPGVILRVAENSTVRMLSDKLADTQVELLKGSAILESTDARKDTAVTMIYKDWQVRVPKQGVYRIDAMPAEVKAYRGEIEVAGRKDMTPVTVKEGEVLPLAAVLLTDRALSAEGDSFKTWAMNRSEAIASDNATAAEITDDPDQFDNSTLDSGGGFGGFTYFPPTGISSLGINNPYGVSFWSPYQSMLNSIYFPPYLSYAYDPLHPAWPLGGGLLGGGVGRIGGIRSYNPLSPLHSSPIYSPLRSTGGYLHLGGPAYGPIRSMPSRIPTHVAAPPVVHAPAVHR